MKSHRYHLVDVFTDRAFGGNPLAVFLDGNAVPERLMQSIAKEMNLSETTFVFPPRNAETDQRVRIFTPGSELPMAGHPTVGTAFILAREGLVRPAPQRSTVTFEEGVGPIAVTIEWKDGAPAFIEMRQPLPKFGPRFDDLETIAKMLSLEPEAVSRTKLPVEVISSGVPFLFVPVENLAAMRRIRFRSDVGERVLGDGAAGGVFVFCRETQHAGSDVHSRMFAPGLGVQEDPATGSATGPLGCYLVRYGVIASEGELRCVSEQGVEMGRPSFLHIRIAHTAGEISAVHVGGSCHYMGSGQLELDDAV